MNLLRLSTSPLPVASSWYAIPLRLIVGIGFIQHGPEDFIGILHAMRLDCIRDSSRHMSPQARYR